MIKSEDGKMLVHYDGGTAEEDEWIDPVAEGARIKDVVEAVQVCCTASIKRLCRGRNAFN